FVVRDGSLRVMKEINGTMKQLVVMKPGDLVGEMSLLYGHPRSATLVAATGAVLLCLSKDIFERIMSGEARRNAMMQQATDRILRTETLTSVADLPGAVSAERPKMHAVRVDVKMGWFSRSYLHVKVSDPHLAGMACLSMTADYYGIAGPAGEDIEQRMQESQ